VLSGILRHISGRKNVLFAVLVSEFAIIFVDFVLVFLFGSQFHSYWGYIFGSNDKETLLALFFLEGAVIFGIGALFAAGISETKMASSTNPATSYVLSKISKQREEHREKQISTGFMLMLVGAPLLVISLVMCLV